MHGEAKKSKKTTIRLTFFIIFIFVAKIDR